MDFKVDIKYDYRGDYRGGIREYFRESKVIRSESGLCHVNLKI